MNWEIDKVALIELLGKTIYRPENVLVEITANSYDADASIVKVRSSGENQKIQVFDNGCGMNEEDLKILTTIAKSKKREYIENKQLTPKFDRKYLGSFGIGIISFLSLGNVIRIFTKKEGEKPLFVEIRRQVDENTGKTIDIPISQIESSNDFLMHLIDGDDTVSGTTIEIENTKLDFSLNFPALKYKLSNLPLSDNFKVFINNSIVKQDDYPINSWQNKEYEISLDDIDPDYKSKVDLHIYYNPEAPSETIEEFKRGIFLKVHGRVIEHNLYSKFRANLTSPGSVDARLTGFIEADYLFTKIQANREDFFDNNIIDKICKQLEPQVQSLINDFLLLKNFASEYAYINQYNIDKEEALNRIRNVHKDLDALGVKFKYEPTCEQEVIVIMTELAQLGHLEFEVVKINSRTHIDCLVVWSPTQTQRMPEFIGHLEVETELHKFFMHQHDFRTKPEICCWRIDERPLEREIKKYQKGRPESIKEIELKEPTEFDSDHFKHQKELHIQVQTEHNEYSTKVLRVYVLADIIKNKAESINN